jgi:hypothetical protein
MSGARGGGLRPGRDFWTKEAYARPVTRRTACMLVAGVICLLTAAPPASARYIRLSDERTRTYSAFLDYPTPVRVKPGLRARKLTSLTPFTYHGRHEVVLVLGRLRTARRTWVRIRYPGLGRRVGWVTDRVLSASRLHRDLIVVDREALELRNPPRRPAGRTSASGSRCLPALRSTARLHSARAPSPATGRTGLAAGRWGSMARTRPGSFPVTSRMAASGSGTRTFWLWAGESRSARRSYSRAGPAS